VDQRREPRFPVNQVLAVTLLATRTKHHGSVKNASGRGLMLELPTPVWPGTAIQIDLPDALVLGEVVYCRKGHATWLLGIELDQMLQGLSRFGRACLDSVERPRDALQNTDQ
jgi:hypothetical protein